jgi:hypothetical protein
MKRFLLLIIGDFSSEKICKDIALSIYPLVDSPQLKFQHSKGVLIFHFASEVTQEEIETYIQGILYGITNSFILTEFTDKVSVVMPDNIKEHLINLDKSDDDVEMKISIDESFNIFEESEDDEFVALLLDEVKKKIKKPTLDQILDKILSKGVESLSVFEKEILETYSKN